MEHAGSGAGSTHQTAGSSVLRRPNAELSFWLAAMLAASTLGCEMTGPAKGSPQTTSAAATPPRAPGTAPVERAEARLEPKDRCIVPLVEPAPAPAAAASQCPNDPASKPELPVGRVRFPEAPGAPSVAVERALTDATRSRGLMYRTALGADEGMIFSWDKEEARSFWMLNTCIPLDMLFIAADGTIVGIVEQVPTLNTLPRGVPCPAQHVLEVNAGWTRQHGVKPGQKVEIET